MVKEGDNAFARLQDAARACNAPLEAQKRAIVEAMMRDGGDGEWVCGEPARECDLTTLNWVPTSWVDAAEVARDKRVFDAECLPTLLQTQPASSTTFATRSARALPPRSSSSRTAVAQSGGCR